MFRKIVSNLSFSPALVGQLSFYAKRLRKEELTRRLGLIFTVMALVVQSLAVFSPPEAANASSSADFVRGGVSSVSDFLKYYDRNSNNIKTIYNSLGITRAEIASAKPTVIGEGSRYNWSMTSLYSYSQGQRKWDYGPHNAYYRPMRLTQEGGDRHPVFYANSKEQGWFAIKKDCGNLITAKPPHKPNPVAACTNLNIVPLSSTRFRFDGKSSKKNGASISAYEYVVSKDGKTIDTITKKTSSLSNSTEYTQVAPGSYSVKLYVSTSVGKKYESDCSGKFTVAQNPVAACKSLQIDIQDRDIVALTGNATTQGGATVSKYTFIVKDASGKIVKTLATDSTSLSANADSFTLTPGTYSVELSVTTSVGIVKDGTDCVKQFTIQKPEVCQYNPQLPPNSPDCQPCPENPEVWIKDEKCNAEIIDNKSGLNLSQGNVSATTTTAKAGDKISYTITSKNQGLVSQAVTMKEELKDVLEYSSLIDAGTGTFNQDEKTLTWPAVTLAANQQQSRTFVVQLMSPVPLTNTGTSDESSYDCRMVNTFGNAVEVPVDCAPEKVIVEQTVAELPRTGPRENMIFAGILFSIVIYFYARSRQLGKEVRLIRRNVTTGAI